MANSNVEGRVRVLLAVTVVLLSMLGTRLWFLQVLDVENARAAAARNSLRLVSVPAPRGRILDANGEVLVSNRLSLQITVNRQLVGDARERVLFELSKLLDVPASVLGERLDDVRYYAYTPVPIASDVEPEVAYYVLEHRDSLPGVDVRKEPVRVYSNGSLAAHVLGYLGEISAQQLKDPALVDYDPGDVLGKAGVEAVYERDLRGTEGFVSYRVDSTGKNLGEFGRKDPTPGNDVVLTIDGDVQGLAEESLVLGIEQARDVLDPNTGTDYRATGGAVVVLDADTGAVRALASYPTYEPSDFVEGLTQTEYEKRFGEGSDFPLLNRAIQGQYPPGSTFKPWVMLSALRRNLVSTSQGYPCPASWSVPGDTRLFRNWASTDQGVMTLARSLSESCDTIFYPMGYEFWRLYYPPPSADGIPGNDDEKPREPLQGDLRATGFDRPTGVDLPSEYDGRVPDSLWKLTIHQRFPQDFPYGDWVPGDFVNMSIGQGDTLVTPMQMAQAYAALLNGGRVCRPHLLGSIRTSGGRLVRDPGDACGRRLPFDRDQLEYVRNALVGTVREGTAAGAFRGFPFGEVWVAGKTGTAQVFGKQDFSWFAGMAVSGTRRYVVVSVVEQGGHGSTTAAPIARRIIEGLYGLDLSDLVAAGATD